MTQERILGFLIGLGAGTVLALALKEPPTEQDQTECEQQDDAPSNLIRDELDRQLQ